MGKDLKGKELGQGLYQKKNGLYEVKMSIKGRKINFCRKDLRKLKKDLEEVKRDIEDEINLDKSNVTLRDWFDEWFTTYKVPMLKSTSVSPMRNRFYRFCGVLLGSVKLSELKNILIQETINSRLQEGVAISTIRENVGLLSQCLESAKRNKFIRENPTFDLIIPRASNKKVKRMFLTQEQQTEFLLSSEGTFYEEMFYIMFLTGLRVGEIGALTWDNIDFKEKTIEVNKALSCEYEGGVKTQKIVEPKTLNSYRKIPFVGEAGVMLQRQKEKQLRLRQHLGSRWRSIGEDLVFTTNMGSPVTRYVAEKAIRGIVNDINTHREFNAKVMGEEYDAFPKLYPHAIRHTFCSRCFERGLDPKTVQMLMGHAHYSTTIDIYTHVTGKTYDEEVKKFGSAIV